MPLPVTISGANVQCAYNLILRFDQMNYDYMCRPDFRIVMYDYTICDIYHKLNVGA